MGHTTTAAEVKQRLIKYLAVATRSTQQVVCDHASLNVDGLRVMPCPNKLSNCAAEADNDDTLLNAEGSRILWPMCADAKLAALPVGSGDGVGPAGRAVGRDVLCFLIDTLTSAHLTIMTGRHRHVSMTIGVEFAEPLCVGQPFMLTSCLLRVGQRISFLSAEIHQQRGEQKAAVCAGGSPQGVLRRTSAACSPSAREQVVMALTSSSAAPLD
ncbi:hypothetical protein TraAM80_08769 [Trypanosoma rangeli]|uniref:Thioesterase domain-containing protein n=1 Tax=Trypanosoma rangeli TaxID=5698 RepID=A0A422MZ94_TRYRA|nr:uncharacterized protein TraAM80_08769 [Trypanosoma rangeli]RNE98543.1 hypothetical protein TraAM80_08769 [Trypanosoma rangeli]|eukprot:RNE98543.1 hypothetical protein TraAM80_08769 [Trypanosoma rangeli]